MILRINDIYEAMKRLVGWERELDPQSRVKSELMESESGLTYQGAHALLTITNVRSIMPDASQFTVPTWNSTASYHKDDIVKKNGVKYIAVSANVGQDPEAVDYSGDYSTDCGVYGGGNAYWRVYHELSEYLANAEKSAVSAMVNRFVEEKSVKGATKSLLEHKCLFDGAGRQNNLVTSTNSMVGYELEMLKGIGVTAQIHKIGLQMNGGDGAIRIYLMHSSQTSPIAHYDLHITGGGGYKWFTIPECFLHYMDGSTMAGGRWYICYLQSDMPQGMSAVNISKDFSREPCGYCNIGNARDWNALTKLVRVNPFRVGVEADFDTNPEMWDLEDMDYTPQTCYGINLEMSVGCDLTDFIIANKRMFATALQKQVAYDLLKRMAYNPEVVVNRNQSNVQRQDILLELDGNSYTHSKGLRGELDRAYKSLEVDTSGIDQVCLCSARKGVNYRAV